MSEEGGRKGVREIKFTYYVQKHGKCASILVSITYTATERATSADAAFCTWATGTSVFSLAVFSHEQSRLSSPAIQSFGSELSERGSQARSVSRRILAASDDKFGSNLLSDFMIGNIKTRLTREANETCGEGDTWEEEEDSFALLDALWSSISLMDCHKPRRAFSLYSMRLAYVVLLVLHSLQIMEASSSGVFPSSTGRPRSSSLLISATPLGTEMWSAMRVRPS